jgi:hypothetical protein
VRAAVTSQETISQPGLPSTRDISAETRKMPDPIIEPTTTIVASKAPRPALELGVEAGVGFGVGSSQFSPSLRRIARQNRRQARRRRPRPAARQLQGVEDGDARRRCGRKDQGNLGAAEDLMPWAEAATRRSVTRREVAGDGAALAPGSLPP